MPAQSSLLRLDWRRGRGTVANYLDHDLPVPCPDEVRLLCRLGPYAPGGQRLQRALVKLFAVANVHCPGKYDHEPIVRVEMWLYLEVCGQPQTNYVHSRRLVVTGKLGDVDTAGCTSPFQIVRGEPDRFQSLAW